MAEQQTVWREGDRIRATDGMGFHDRVTDKALAEYAADITLAPYDRAFAAAVLAMREFERADPRQTTPDRPALDAARGES